jgi:hypothetical protein
MKIDKEVERLFKQVMTSLGSPVRRVQLTQDMLCDLLQVAVEDYAEKTLNFIVESQWATLYGKNLSNMDLAFALTIRTLDYAKSIAQWHSKEVGLQQQGPWELKKDFITIENGKQSYLVPAGRAINSVMYVTPPTTKAALYGAYGAGFDSGFGGGISQLGWGGIGGMAGGFYMGQTADIAYLATDLTYKRRLLFGDLTYKVTGGPDGTHIIHLINGNSKNTQHGGIGGFGLYNYVGCTVWYTYYDTTADNINDCLRQNPDVILTPDQVPLNKMEFAFMNEPTKVIIRQLLVAKAKETLGIIRGTNSGRVSIPDAELNLDYQMLLTQGQQEYQRTMDALVQRLERMTPYAIMEKQAKLVQDTSAALSGVPMGLYVK